MTTTNMGLTLPDVSVTPGPTWASQINSDLTLIDQHNHIPSANGGVAITSAALQIDADVPFDTVLAGGAAATGLSYLGLLAPVGSQNIATRVYSDSAGDLYYDNAAGSPVRITNGASVAGTQGSISNLNTPAAANYDLGTTTFQWTSSANVGANMDSGPVTVRDGTAGAQGITLTPPVGLASSYTLTLPSSAPAAQRLLTVNAGVSTLAAVDSTLSLTSTALSVANNGITQAQLASNSVTTLKIANAAVTQAKLSSTTYNESPSSASVFSYTNVTTETKVTELSGVAILSAQANRLMCISLRSCGQPVSLYYTGSLLRSPQPFTIFYRITGPSGVVDVGHQQASGDEIPPSAFAHYYLPTQSGFYTVDVYVNRGLQTATTNVEFASVQLFVCQF